MPTYEYVCPECNCKFELIRPRNECNQGSTCPQCGSSAERVISSFSHYSASAPDSSQKKRDTMDEKMWVSQRKMEDDKIKNPDPLKEWRKEREKTLGVGPGKWGEWAKEEKGKEQKKKDYGEGWLGREA